MKIDSITINILKNFAKINPSLLITEGNVLKTISPSKTIMAKAIVPTSFDNRFAIYNLDRFISTLSLFNDPELIFKDKYLTIKDGKRKTNYTFAEESLIKTPPDKDIILPSIDVSCKITNENLKDIEKGAGVLGLPEIVITGNGETISIQAVDTKNPSGDLYSIDIGETAKNFVAVFKFENIKIIPGDYEVNICSKGISHFKGENIEYWIAVESNSKFE